MTGLARRALRRVTERCLGAILLYHRIAEVESDPQLLCVTPEHFSEQLEVLREHAPAIDLAELVVRSNRRVSSALTFDDGYADNLTAAKSLLARYAAPATVFVVTGRLGGGEFWWDELEQLLLGGRGLPRTLDVQIDGRQHRWDLGDEGQDQRAPSWSVLDGTTPSGRHRAYRELCELARPLDEPARIDVLRQVAAAANTTTTTRETHRALTDAEVVDLAADGLVTVGAHTHTHPVLAHRPSAGQRVELEASKRRLEELTGRPVERFSYPYGTHADYTRETVQLVQDVGFRLACSNVAGPVRSHSPRLELPRFLVRDWPGDEFERRLHEWLRAP